MRGHFERTAAGPVVVSPKDERRKISTVKEWLQWAGPLRGEKQWADGRSAKEVAKAWCAEGIVSVPPDLQALLDSNATLGAFRAATVIPELSTPLGDVPRGARRHDLVILGLDSAGRKTLVGVEAKADEPFDAPVAKRIEQARNAAAKAAAEQREDASAQIPRIEMFARALLARDAFTPDGEVDDVVGELPYQLLAGLAGTLIEAQRRGADQSAFVVHAFHSDTLDKERVKANDAGFARFLTALPHGSEVTARYGTLHGPLAVPGSKTIPAMPLYIGITATALR